MIETMGGSMKTAFKLDDVILCDGIEGKIVDIIQTNYATEFIDKNMETFLTNNRSNEKMKIGQTEPACVSYDWDDEYGTSGIQYVIEVSYQDTRIPAIRRISYRIRSEKNLVFENLKTDFCKIDED